MKLRDMRRAVTFPFLVILLMTAPFSTFSQEELDLESVRKLARENYPLFMQYDLLELAEEYNISNANKAYYPQVSANIIGGLIFGLPSFSPGSEETSTEANLIGIVQINQNLWDGGRTKANKELIRLESDIQEKDLDISLKSIESSVDEVYFSILLLDGQIEQSKIYTGILETNFEHVQALYKNGTAFKSDLDEIEVETIINDQKLDELIYTRSAFMNMLALMIGRTLDTSMKLVTPDLNPVELDQELKRMELEKFAMNREMTEAQLKMQKSSLYPSVGLLGFGTFLSPGIDFGPTKLTEIGVVGLNLSWNIGGLYQNKNNKRLAQVRLDQIDLQEKTFRYHTRLNIIQYQDQIQRFEDLLEQDERMIELRMSIQNSYQKKYDNGVVTMSQLLTKVDQTNSAKQNLVLHEVQYLKTLNKLNFEIGN